MSTTRTVYVTVEGRERGGVFGVAVNADDFDQPFTWLLGRLNQPDSALYFTGVTVVCFRTATHDVAWMDIIRPYLETNSRDNPLLIVREILPIAQAIPAEVQESVVVLAEAIRSRSNSVTSSGSNAAAAEAATAHMMGRTV